MKFFGLPVNTIIKIGFIAIGIFLSLIILTLLQ